MKGIGGFLFLYLEVCPCYEVIMERDEDLLFSVIDFLLAHGYPPESMAMEWSIGGKYRVDLAVIDPDTNKAIALFELKRRKNADSLKMAIRQLEAYSNALGDEQVPTYVVFGKDGDPPFEMYHLERGGLRESDDQALNIVKVPDFSVLKNTRFRQILAQTEEKRKRSLGSFQIVCWIMGT
jgi:hypothetical protein